MNCLVQVCLGSWMTAKCDLGCVHQRVATLGPFLILQADRNGTLRGFFGGGEGVGCTLSGTGVSQQSSDLKVCFRLCLLGGRKL